MGWSPELPAATAKEAGPHTFPIRPRCRSLSQGLVHMAVCLQLEHVSGISFKTWQLFIRIKKTLAFIVHRHAPCLHRMDISDMPRHLRDCCPVSSS
eukprot:4575975-Amphidinium_carterae.1